MSKTKFLSAWGIALALIFAVFACGDDTTSIEGEHEGYPFSMQSYTISYKIVNNP